MQLNTVAKKHLKLIYLQRKKKTIYFCIKDNGIGMSSKHLEKIFLYLNDYTPERNMKEQE